MVAEPTPTGWEIRWSASAKTIQWLDRLFGQHQVGIISYRSFII
jgi:hypothetical protein